MAELFVHPGLAWLAALAAVPLLIHLFQRRRPRPKPWGAMRFVLAAHRRMRRRIELENLLLLLLRMAAVALLALCLARPLSRGDGPLTALTETRRDLVLIVDASASTGYRTGAESVADRIRERARERIASRSAARGDRVVLIESAARSRALGTFSPDEALALLSALGPPRDERLDLAAMVAEVVAVIEEQRRAPTGAPLEVRWLTDLQRGNFESLEAGETSDTPMNSPAAAAAACDRLAALGAEILVEDLGSAEAVPENLTVTALVVRAPPGAAGRPAELEVEIHNHGPRPRGGVRVALSVDGERRASQSLDVPARSSARETFSAAFRESGYHLVEARLEGDGLAVDDVRASVVRVPPPLSVLLVDGAPHADVERDAVGMLSTILSPLDDGAGQVEPFHPRVAAQAELNAGELDLSPFDAIWLADPAPLSSPAVAALEARVARGAGLIVSAGPNTDAAELTRKLWRADGSGLLPAELGARIDVGSARMQYYRVKSFDELHPALSFFADERWRPLLCEAPFQAFLSATPLDGARVLARFDDPGATPFLIERAFDRGSVCLWTSSANAAWNRLAESPASIVPLVHELLRHAARPYAPPRDVAVGGALVAELDRLPRGLSVQAPDGSERTPNGEPEQLAADLWRLPSVVADRAGPWRYRSEGETAAIFAAQLDPREGDLARLEPGLLATLHPALVPADRGERAADGPAQRGSRGEIWRLVAWICLAALAAESVWAAWIGWRRR